MSEKLTHAESSEHSDADVSLVEINALAESGFKDKALRLARIKLGVLEAIVTDIRNVVAGESGILPQSDWEKEKFFIEEQILELQNWITIQSNNE